MGGRRIPDEVKELVETYWLRNRKNKPTAKDVMAAVNRQAGYETIGLRSTQQVITELKRRARPYEPFEWQPWPDVDVEERRSDDSTSKSVQDSRIPTGSQMPEDVRYLLQMNLYWRLGFGRSLYAHEAGWATRLRAFHERIPDFVREDLNESIRSDIADAIFAAMVKLYSQREEIALSLDRTIETADLDDLLAWEPWSIGRWAGFEVAIKTGLVRSPKMFVEYQPNTGKPVMVSGSDAMLMWLFKAGGDLRRLDDLGTVVQAPQDSPDGDLMETGRLTPKAKDYFLKAIFERDVDDWREELHQSKEGGK